MFCNISPKCLNDVEFPEQMWEWVSCHETKITKNGCYRTIFM